MKTVWLKEGTEFNQAEPAEVADFLRSRSLKHLELDPERLHIANDGKALLLQVSNGALHEYPIRKSFLFKLLKWFSFPVRQIHRLNIDTVTSVLNDFVLNIHSGKVTVTIEDEEALTITSSKFSRLSDLDVFDLCGTLRVEHISRNDFFLRLYSEVNYKEEIVKGDLCGFGYNVLNSETGFRTLSVHHYLLRYICSNGAIVRTSMKEERVHYGHDVNELKDWLAEQLRGAEEERAGLMTSLRNTLSVKSGTQSETLSKKLGGLVGRVEGEAIMGKISDSMTLFDVLNLLTQEAKRFDVGRRLQLESIAGNLLQDVQDA